MSKKRRFLFLVILFTLSIILTSCSLLRQDRWPDIPNNGKWKCDELNLVLDFGTGYGDLLTENGTIKLIILCQPNYPDIDLVTDERINIEGEESGTHTAYFHGTYMGIEDGRLCLMEDGTDQLFWFYSIDDESKTGDVSLS